MDYQYDLNFLDAYVDQEYLYAVGLENNIFFRARRDGGYSVEILGILKGFRNKDAGVVYAVQYYDDSLYMFLDRTYEIARYDLKSKKYSYYYPADDYDGNDIMHGICRVENEVWIFRNAFERKLCIFSLQDYSYRFFELDLSVLLDNVEQKNVKRAARENICLVGNKIWRCIAGTNYVYSVDTATKQLAVHRMDADIELFTVNHDNEGFVFLSLYGEYIIRWDENKGVTEKKEICNGKKSFKAFRNIIQTLRGYLLIPALSDEIRFLPDEGETTVTLAFPSQFRRRKDVKGLFARYYQEEKKILLFPFGGNGLIEIQSDTLKSEYYPVCITEEKYMRSLIAENQNIAESRTLSFKSYIGLLNTGIYGGERADGNIRTKGKQIMKEMGRSS